MKFSDSRFLITLGDPNGIGSEITANALRELLPEEQSQFEIIGSYNSWSHFNKGLEHLVFHKIPCSRIHFGKLDPYAGQISIAALNKAIQLLKTNTYQGLITAPISKEAVVLSGVKNFIGHTEYLGQAFSCPTEMIFWSSDWSLILATVHIPLSQVSHTLTPERLTSVLKNAYFFHQHIYHGNGQIAICGLNPHAGENGILGTEEQSILTPILSEFRSKGCNIIGPVPPDTIFHEARAGKYNFIIALYHDQGLIPFKLLHFHDGVNITLGLPFLRTSPDHGTAFGIAGKNIANHHSMLHAIRFTLKQGTLWHNIYKYPFPKHSF